jgi:hypothetical protein
MEVQCNSAAVNVVIGNESLIFDPSHSGSADLHNLERVIAETRNFDILSVKASLAIFIYNLHNGIVVNIKKTNLVNILANFIWEI